MMPKKRREESIPSARADAGDSAPCFLILLWPAPHTRTVRHSQPMQWIYLAIAIVSEVVATSALKAAEGFTRLVPSTLVVVGYALAFYFLSLTLRTIPLGVAYAIWAGVGVALVALVGWVVYHQSLDIAALIGISLIVSGVIVLNLFSKTVVH